MSATNSTGRANHSLLMSSASRNAVIDFDVPPTASHQNNSAKLVRTNALETACDACFRFSAPKLHVRTHLSRADPTHALQHGSLPRMWLVPAKRSEERRVGKEC